MPDFGTLSPGLYSPGRVEITVAINALQLSKRHGNGPSGNAPEDQDMGMCGPFSRARQAQIERSDAGPGAIGTPEDNVLVTDEYSFLRALPLLE